MNHFRRGKIKAIKVDGWWVIRESDALGIPSEPFTGGTIKFVSTRQTGTMLGIGKRCVNRLIESNKLPALDVIMKTITISDEVFDRLNELIEVLSYNRTGYEDMDISLFFEEVSKGAMIVLPAMEDYDVQLFDKTLEFLLYASEYEWVEDAIKVINKSKELASNDNS